MSFLAAISARVKQAAEFIIEHAGPFRTFIERAVEAVQGLLRLDWRGEPVAAASVVVVALTQAFPSISDTSLSVLERTIAAAVVFSSAIAASTQTRAKSALPKKYGQ